MRMTDRDSRTECHVIPFHKPELQEENVTTTSIAAVIAVTILHSDDISPEDKLLEIIEASGEAEVLDADEAFMGLDDRTGIATPSAMNDNKAFSVIHP